eukprot:UC4_evm1s469
MEEDTVDSDSDHDERVQERKQKFIKKRAERKSAYLDKVKGKVDIKVVCAKNLKRMDPFPFSSDPYVVMKSGHKMVKTEVVENNLNPIWNENFTLPLFGIEEPLRICVLDRDLDKDSDDIIGDAVLYLKDHEPYSHVELNIDLADEKGTKGQCGVLCLQLHIQAEYEATKRDILP